MTEKTKQNKILKSQNTSRNKRKCIPVRGNLFRVPTWLFSEQFLQTKLCAAGLLTYIDFKCNNTERIWTWKAFIFHNNKSTDAINGLFRNKQVNTRANTCINLNLSPLSRGSRNKKGWTETPSFYLCYSDYIFENPNKRGKRSMIQLNIQTPKTPIGYLASDLLQRM